MRRAVRAGWRMLRAHGGGEGCDARNSDYQSPIFSRVPRRFAMFL